MNRVWKSLTYKLSLSINDTLTFGTTWNFEGLKQHSSANTIGTTLGCLFSYMYYCCLLVIAFSLIVLETSKVWDTKVSIMIKKIVQKEIEFKHLSE